MQAATRQTPLISDVSSSPPQQATSNYLCLELYACAFAVVVPARRGLRLVVLQVVNGGEFPVGSSRVQFPHCLQSLGLRCAFCAAVVSTNDASELFQLGELS